MGASPGPNPAGSRLRALAAALLSVAGAGAARADDVAEFYKAHPVSLVVGHEAGTGFDLYARVLARHFGRHLPGAPNVDVRNMQGASGLVAGNWLYNVAPKDGSVFATFAHTVLFEPLLGDNTARFDARKFTFLANIEDGLPICGVSPGSGVSRFSDLLEKPVVFGASGGGGGPLSQATNATRALTGAKISLINGYRGSYDVKLAIDRGEVFGICGISDSSIRTEWRDMLDSGRFKFILRLARKTRPDLSDAPSIYDYAKTPEDNQVFDLVFGLQALGRVYLAPPGLPPARADALEKAMMETVADPAFRADAAQAGLELQPADGAAVEKLVAQFYAATPEAVARAKSAVRAK